MSYLEVYKKRISHLGTNPQDRAYQSGILEFRRYLKYNQHTERNLTILRDSTIFDGVILTDNEDENRVSQILLVKVLEDGGPAIQQGDLIQWGDGNPWLVYRTTTSSYQPHQKFYMVRCNHYIKWIDEQGKLNESWVYLLGSKDSKIKDNFRTWHNVITPQPNKYINIIMPHKLMPLNTEIMVIDEVWYLVDYDQSSVPGIIFMSFTETNLNQQRDDVDNKIANVDKLATWVINMPATRTVAANTIIVPEFAILKNGVIQDAESKISVDGGLTLQDNGLIEVGTTGGTLVVEYEGVSSTQTIIVEEVAKPSYVFVGNEKIRATTKHKYELVGASAADFSVSNNLIKIINVDGNTCTIEANDKNKLGKTTITAICDGISYTKNIQVVSLWQVI